MAQLTPGTYQLVAKSPGFTDVAIKSIELLVDSPATINIKFEKLGGVTTTVQVEAAAVQVNTVDASLGNAISTQAIMELPMYARNVAGLLAFQPGVTSFGAFGTGSLDDRNGSVNGSRSDQSNVTLDGADVNDQNTRAAFTSVLRVTLDSVEEFRTTTTNGDAGTGRGSGANVSLVTKSGTNEFHGSLYEYRRGTETAANSFFNNAANVPIAPLLINVFGGSVGGPIIKNKAFFFVNYEGRRDASSASVTRTVPNDLMRAGSISYHDSSGKVQVLTPSQIKAIDPLGIGDNPAVLQIFQNVYPHGNDTSCGDAVNTTCYRFNTPQHSKQDTYIAKLDYKVDAAGKHNIFVRGNLQNDHTNGTPQFPGQPPNSVSLSNSKGMAAGWTAVLTTHLVSTFRYGFTRSGNEITGITQGSYSWLRGLDTPYGVSSGTARHIPVHTFSEDLTWNHKAHDFAFGVIVRSISNESASNNHSFNVGSSNPSWLKGAGADLTPSSLGVSSTDKQSYQYGIAALLGVLPQGTANYNYLIDGTILPTGALVTRDFANLEAEAYAQDTWKVTHNFTITTGLRFSYEPPVHEANKQQVSPSIPFSEFNDLRGSLASQGLSQMGVGRISFLAADPKTGGRPMYPTHYNVAPRIGLAYSPNGDSGFAKWLFGGSGKTSIRAGFGMYYDEIGQPLAQQFNGTAFGLQTTLQTSPNILTSAQVPRFTSFWNVPSAILTAAPKGGFPQVYPDVFAITNSVDDQLKAPYTMNMNLSFGREFSHGLFVQMSYVGRLSRKTLVNRDVSMPTNLKDPVSGQTYFQAMQQLGSLVDDQGVSIANLPKIPFFEHFWSTAAAKGYSATQIWAMDYTEWYNTGDFTDVVNDFDNASNCSTSGTTFTSSGKVSSAGCGIYGPWMMFNPQFSSLSAWSSIGAGDYHAGQLTIRKRFSGGLMFDLNYTLSKSIDLASHAENSGTAWGVINNTWAPGQMRAVSNYDTLHAVNAYMVWQLPFGRGMKFGSGMSKVVDAIFGGWQVSPAWRMTSGLPTDISNGQVWPTNWEFDSMGTPTGPLPPATSNHNGISVVGPPGPNLWDDANQALKMFHYTKAGESGLRNMIRGDGYFGIDSSVSKTFKMPYKEGHSLQIRWETFNLTNTVRFDPYSNDSSLTSSSTFGKLTDVLGAPRQMQFALRYTF